MNCNGIFNWLNKWIIFYSWGDLQSTGFNQNQYLRTCYKIIHVTIEYLYMFSILYECMADWLIYYFVYQRINQVKYGRKMQYLCSKYQFKRYFQYQRIGILLLGYHLIEYSFIQSINHLLMFWLMHEWLENWIDAYCASYFYYHSNKQQCK